MTARLLGIFLAVLLFTLPLACEPDIGEDEPVPVVVAVLDPETGVLPMPNDLLLDQETGLVAIPDLPTDSEMTLALKDDLRELDGWSNYGPLSAPFDGPLDPSTICLALLSPRDMAGMTRIPEGCDPVTVYMVNISKFEAIPQVEWVYETVESNGQSTGNINLAPNEPYSEQNTYLVVMTDGLRGAQGEQVVPSQVIYLSKSDVPLVDEDGEIALSLLMPQPGQSMEEARETAQLLETLRTSFQVAYLVMGGMGVPKESVVHIWPMTTQTISEPLLTMREVLYSGESTSCPAPATTVTLSCPPPDLPDLEPACTGGNIIDADTFFASQPEIPHDHIAAVAFGTFESPNAIDPETGKLAIDADGTIRCSQETIWFTLVLPEAPPTTPYPVVIMQHGLVMGRNEVLFIADAFAAQGYATIGIDAKFHGARSLNMADNYTNFSLLPGREPVAQPDGFPDCSGAGFIATGTPAPEDDPLGCYDQDYPYSLAGTRDNFRQSVIDMLQLTRVISDPAGLSAVEGIDVDPADISLFGASLGASQGVMYMAVEPTVETAVLYAPLGGFATILSTTQDDWLISMLEQIMEAEGIEEGSSSYWELLNTLQWILDPADAINYARYLITEPMEDHPVKRILVQWANDDQLISDVAADALNWVLGVEAGRIEVYGTEEAPVHHGFILYPDDRNPGATAEAQQDAANFIADEEE